MTVMSTIQLMDEYENRKLNAVEVDVRFREVADLKLMTRKINFIDNVFLKIVLEENHSVSKMSVIVYALCFVVSLVYVQVVCNSTVL